MCRARLPALLALALGLDLGLSGCLDSTFESVEGMRDPGPSLALVDGQGVKQMAAHGIDLPPNDANDAKQFPQDGASDAPATLAMLTLPEPEPLRRHKPQTGAPICGPLAPAGRATGAVTSDGEPFAVECFRANVTTPAPAVIILHGAGGIGHNTIYARLGEQLAARGTNAFIFQYLAPLDRPAVRTPPPKGAAGRTPTGGTAGRQAKAAARPRPIDADAQARAIESALGAVQALDYVDEGQIGLFGLSLGGFHALALAARDPRVGAVVDMFGAMPHPVEASVQRMPPTLILHGDRDAIVPVKRAQELAKLLKKVGASYEMKIYKGQGHSFTGAADQDSVQRSLDFFGRWLRSDNVAGRAP